MAADFARIRHIVLDMDGTIYLGGTLFPQTCPFLATLAALEIGYSFITNNCSRSRSEYAAHLREIGVDAAADDISTSAHATIFHLRERVPHARRLFVLGTEGLCEEFRLAGFAVVDDDPEAVIVGFDIELTYDRLAHTAYWIAQGLPYVATHPDRVCPTDQPIVLPDCGAICALLESATGRCPDAVPGKPSPGMLQAIFKKKNLEPGEVAMVGDRLYTDIRMAREAGALAVLTLTGETTRAQVENAAATDAPDVVVGDLEELSRLLEESRDAR